MFGGGAQVWLQYWYLKEQIVHWYFDTGTYRYFQIIIELVLN